jgi:hypothetical protein
MSDPGKTPAAPPDDIPPPRHGCLTALMVLVGIVLLLPGLCTLYFHFAENTPFSPLFVVIALSTFILGFGGIIMIWLALRE